MFALFKVNETHDYNSDDSMEEDPVDADKLIGVSEDKYKLEAYIESEHSKAAKINQKHTRYNNLVNDFIRRQSLPPHSGEWVKLGYSPVGEEQKKHSEKKQKWQASERAHINAKYKICDDAHEYAMSKIIKENPQLNEEELRDIKNGVSKPGFIIKEAKVF